MAGKLFTFRGEYKFQRKNPFSYNKLLNCQMGKSEMECFVLFNIQAFIKKNLWSSVECGEFKQNACVRGMQQLNFGIICLRMDKNIE